jgi:hypothetical protein
MSEDSCRASIFGGWEMFGIHSVWDLIAAVFFAPIALAIFLIGAFMDDFPLSLVTFPVMFATIGATLVLVATRLVHVLNGLGRLILWQSTPLRRQMQELRAFALFCAIFIPLALFGGTFFVFTFGGYLQLFAAAPDQVEQLLDRSFSQWAEDTWSMTIWGFNCSAWHSWKGLPEGNLALLEWAGLIEGQYSKLFSYNCNEWFRRYSVAISLLISPAVMMSIWAACKVVYLRGRSLLGFSSPRDSGPGWGDELAAMLGWTTTNQIVDEIFDDRTQVRL